MEHLASPEDLARAFACLPVPTLLLDLDLVVLAVDDAYTAATHRSRADLLGRQLFHALAEDPAAPASDVLRMVRRSLERARATGHPDTVAMQRYDVEVPGSGREQRWWSAVSVPVRDEDGQVRLLLHQVQDVTRDVLGADGGTDVDPTSRLQALAALNEQLLLARDELRDRALHDPLTGLLVRSVFSSELTRALRRQARHPQPVAVLFLDLDRLKHVNDHYGHSAGDALLRSCAQRLEASVRPQDVVARIGGDEFVVLLEELPDEREAVLVAERVLAHLCRPFGLPGGGEVELSVSIGVAVGTSGGGADAATAGETLVGRADAAMYRAKQAGRGRVQLFDQAAHEAVQARERLGDELRAALPLGQLRLHYQPIVDLRTDRPCAYEALLRWQHPVRGLLPAAEFVEVAEEHGLILELGAWVLEQACAELAGWAAPDGTGPDQVFVNVAAVEVTRGLLAERLQRALSGHGVRPEQLVLEITETGVLQLDDTASDGPLDRVRALGVALAIDDFGTGHSSLSRLRHLPAQILKIDRSFVQSVATDPTATAVVSAVVLLAHELGKTVVAEGVEDEATLSRLRDLGCDLAQGYALAAPVSARELARTAP